MKWDSSRPVPWQKLVREWVVYAIVMSAVFLIFFSSNNVIGAIAGVLISGPLYLAVGASLAKFGYTRKSFKELRAESKAEVADKKEPSSKSGGTRERSDTNSAPARTSRTSSGSNRPNSSSRKRR